MLIPDISRIRSPILYPGGKRKAIRHLCYLIPAGTEAVVSPFFGGGSVELAVEAAGVRVGAGDASPPLALFWRHALTDAAGLAAVVERFFFASFDGADYRRAQQEYGRLAAENPILGAAVYYAINRHSFCGLALEAGSYSGRGFLDDPRRGLNRTILRRLARFRAPRLTFRQADYRETLDRYPDRFAIVDPPYLDDHRNRRFYGEVGGGFDHEELAERLLRRPAGFILTVEDGPVIRRLYRGCRMAPVSWSRGFVAGGKEKGVIVWRTS